MKGATFAALRFSVKPRQKTCNQTHLQTHHPQDQPTTKLHLMLQTLETFWLQQDEDLQELNRSL
jgi:hypothetical protein